MCRYRDRKKWCRSQAGASKAKEAVKSPSRSCWVLKEEFIRVREVPLKEQHK